MARQLHIKKPVKMGFKKNGKGQKLESALKKYIGEQEKLSFQEKLTYAIVKLALNKGSESFDVSKEQMVES